MNKRIQAILTIIFILIGIVFIAFKNNIKTNKSLSEDVDNTLSTSTEQDSSDTTNLNRNVTVTTTGSVPDRAWATFEKYIEYANAHNIEGVRSLSYKFNGTCSKVEESEDMKKKCFTILDNVYKTGIAMSKSDFSSTPFDSKQIILSTNVKKTDYADKVEITKNLIYFIINESNEMRLLALELGRSFTIEKEGLSLEKLNLAVEERIKDSDNDGLEDIIESCLIKTTNPVCKTTDLFKKDSDNDGYWDGVEPLL